MHTNTHKHRGVPSRTGPGPGQATQPAGLARAISKPAQLPAQIQEARVSLPVAAMVSESESMRACPARRGAATQRGAVTHWQLVTLWQRATHLRRATHWQQATHWQLAACPARHGAATQLAGRKKTRRKTRMSRQRFGAVSPG